MNINQDQLIIFITVMETGSFSAAARQLGKVPSAISMSIANLEIDLDLKLPQPNCTGIHSTKWHSGKKWFHARFRRNRN